MRWAVLAAVLLATPAHAAWKHVDLSTDVVLRAVSVVDGQHFQVSGSKGTHAVTEDGGQTWRQAAPTDGAALDFRGVAALDAKTAVLMSAGEGPKGLARLYRTTDGGLTWTLVYETRLEGSFLDAVAFRDAKRGYVLGDPIDGRWFLLKTTDGGQSWEQVPGPSTDEGEAAFAASNSALFVGPGREFWIVSGGLEKARVAHTTDDGDRWLSTDTRMEAGPTAGAFGVLALGKGRAVVVGGDYKDELRDNGGFVMVEDNDAWTPEHIGAARLLEGVGRLDGKTLIAVGPRGTSVSADEGRSWKQVDEEAFHAIACAKGACVAAGAKGKVAVWVP
jgi:photosystem II stability/assembly factor-like uncharacterized protein